MSAAARELLNDYSRQAGVKHHPASTLATYTAPPMPVGGTLKRIFDGGLVLLTGPVVLPLVLAIAIAIKLTSRGPVLFAHERVGFRGRTFRCLKFRTMVTESEDVLARHLADNPSARYEWETSRKLQNDPRVTRVGRILRALSLDELPQLLNVLRGEMSLVGPRPVVRDELARYRTSVFYYVSARPGLTGLWQVSGRNDVSYDYRVQLDRSYVSSWSFLSDLRILLRTIPAVVAARGSY